RILWSVYLIFTAVETGLLMLAGMSFFDAICHEIAEAKQIPEKFLAKIFQSLSRSGIVRSHRGVNGGFTLSRDPHEITVREVLESIQGPYHLTRCIPNRNKCDMPGFCTLRELLIKAENELVNVFEQHTLGNLRDWEITMQGEL
ncbi:MAG: Rrf2 family transcriptional regulator, partial [candidate division Zixibacteria bacterium]|nr:Rrf2 family transcriptional regulator [candidate division Zixibacteria bacterium]